MYGRFRPVKVIILAGLIIAVAIFWLAERNLHQAVRGAALSRAQIRGQELLFRSIYRSSASNLGYNDLVSVHKDSDGRVVMLQPLTVKMNRFMAMVALEIEHSLEAEMRRQDISVPAGQVFGSTIMGGAGPMVHVRILPAGRVQVEMEDRFESAGINQTRHLVCLKVRGKMQVLAPFLREEVPISADVPIVESIIVGQVPGTYVNLDAVGPLTGLDGLRKLKADSD